MGPIILVMLFPVMLVVFVLYANKHQKKSKEEFTKTCEAQGWEVRDVGVSFGYDLFPKNDEHWKLEVRPSGSKKTAPSVIWSHPMPSPQTPLVIIRTMKIAIMTAVTVKGLQISQPDILKNIRPISAGSELSPRFAVYGVMDADQHPFLTTSIQDRLLSYEGGHVIVILFPNRLEVRLVDRNVQTNFAAIIQLGKDLVEIHNSK